VLTRRHILQFGAAAPFAPAALPASGAIARIEIFPVAYAVTAHFKFFTRPERPAIFVKVTGESGATGWGQSVPTHTWSYETVESAATALEHYLAPALIGREASDIPGAHAAMNRAIAPSFSTGMPIAKAGIDLALHDLVGRTQRKSLPELWGRTPLPRVTLSWTVNPVRLDEIDGLVQQGRARGYRNFNVKIAPDPAFDLELCRRVRALAPLAFLWADANGGYDLKTALDIAPKLAKAGVNVLEQPIRPNLLAGLAELKRQGALPIILDEGVVSSVELEEYIRLGMLDGVAMKPARTAGLWDARRQVEILEARRLMFLGSGLTDPDLALAAALQLYAAYGLRYPAALNGPQFLEGSFLRAPLAVVEGAIATPAGPGLGVEVDEDRVRAASALRKPALIAPGGFTIRDVTSTSLEIAEAGSPVLVYNHGMMLKPGAPGNFTRACYVHPLYAPDGAVLTDDFPKDHYHHRGLSWMWPIVRVDGKTYDPWGCVPGMQARFVSWIAREAGAAAARVAVENGWFIGDRKAVKETVDITVHPAAADSRRLDLALTFEAVSSPVEICGTPDDGKGYGGLCLRFAPRENTTITTDKGREPKDTNLVPHPWAELAGTFAGRRASARVDIDPSHPAYPNGWCLRHYGFLGVNYPGLKPIVIEPGKPLVLKYRLTLNAQG
jgi:L-alanine-DL-glutamate epimerase-like enolase superfamily enzyme